MRPLDLQIIRWTAVAVSSLWIAAIGWSQFGGAAGDYGFRSEAYGKAAAGCGGSYSSRYECKSAIIIDGENEAFYDWVGRFALVFGPPLAAWYAVGRLRQRHEREQAARNHREALRRRRERETALRIGTNGIGPGPSPAVGP